VTLLQIKYTIFLIKKIRLIKVLHLFFTSSKIGQVSNFRESTWITFNAC